ncbi:MAG: hypothetical protein ACREOH_23930, partial [Candidatus Entotheonellia bacterium]
RLTQALSLTSEQQARLGDILQKARQQTLRMREQELTGEARRARMRETQAQTRAQIRTILTDTQRQQYEELIKATERQREDGAPQSRPGRVWVRNAEGKPEPLAVTLGISDDTYTEVLSGDLRQGQEVITGILTTAKRSSAGPPGFGTRPF